MLLVQMNDRTVINNINEKLSDRQGVFAGSKKNVHAELSLAAAQKF